MAIPTGRKVLLITLPFVLLLTTISIHISSQRVYDVAFTRPPIEKSKVWVCSLEDYHLFYKTSFSNLSMPFNSTCLTALVDNNLNDITLRVGLVRLKYEELQATSPKRHVVYFCRHICGGVGDRLRAALSTFYLSLAMNATFTIDMELPVHWEDFFKGLNNKYDTTSTKGGFFDRFNITTLYNDQRSTTSLQLTLAIPLDDSNSTLQRRRDPIDWDYNPDVVDEWYSLENVEEYLFLRQDNDSGREQVAFSGMTFRLQPYKENPHVQDFWESYRLKDLGRAERSYIFFRLFMPKPSNLLRDAIQPYVDQLKGAFVLGMQIRRGGEQKLDGTGEAEGGWEDPARHGAGCVHCMAEKARQLCMSSSSPNCTVWITSDDPLAVAEIQSSFANSTSISVLVSSGPITHIDKSVFSTVDYNATLRMHTRTFVDWYVMAEYSDAFIISRSGFGEHASWYILLNASHFKPAFQFKSDSPVCEFEDYRLIQNRTSEVEF